MTKNKLYKLILIACLLGFLYLFYATNYSGSNHLNVCIIKNATSYPCPSCGTTRAIQLLLYGDFVGSLKMNPFGIIVSVIMAIVPFWIVFDLVSKRETFFFYYKKAEKIIRVKWFAAFLLILVLLNWIWNINKQL